MGHEPHVGLVDAHAERDCRYSNHTVFAQKPVLVAIARGEIKSCVIGDCLVPLTGQIFSQSFSLLA